MLYIYTHTGTEAATGYFSCEPSPLPGLEQALSYLAAHPLDDFMRRHLLRRLARLSVEEAREILGKALSGPAPDAPLQALARELALLRCDDIPPAFHASAPEKEQHAPQAATSLIFLRWQKLPDRVLHQKWGEVFAANIREHRALKSPEKTGLAPLFPDAAPLADTGLPGLSAPFTAPFRARLSDVHKEHLEKIAPGTPAHVRPPSSETAALAEKRLRAQGIIAGREMRHTASLSPIALLRPWNLRAQVRQGRHDFTLEGQATTYGRGLSLPDARASCLMEMVERASAYFSVAGNRLEHLARPALLMTGTRSAMMKEYARVLDPNDFPLETPYRDEPLIWMEGHTPQGHITLVPVQMAGLFCNLDEISLCDSPGSTGIATGCSPEEAKIAALLEILERDAEAVTPFTKASCFRLEADQERDPRIAALLADYAARRIHVQFQDITGPMGVPVFQCFVMSAKGAIAKGHGAGLSARRAVLSALTETPFPYPDGGPSGPVLRNLPVRRLNDLPDYSLPTPPQNLAMLEDLLARNHRSPVYVDMTRADLEFPVVRALIPGLEQTADRDAFSRVPWRLYARYRELFASG